MLHQILIFFHFSVKVSFINVVVLSSEVKHIPSYHFTQDL